MSQYIEVGALPLKTPIATLQTKLATALKVPVATTAPAPQPGFLSKYGIYLLGAAAVGGIIWWRRRKAGGKR